MRRWLVALVAAVAALSLVVPAVAQEDPWSHVEDGEVVVDFYFVWSETCPHCQEAKPFIEELPERYPWLELHSLSTSSEASIEQALGLADVVGEDITGVPAFFLCDQLYVGYDDAEGRGAFLESRLVSCHDQLVAAQTPAGPAVPSTTTTTVAEQLSLPVVGDVDAQSVSLPVFTVTVAALDAFNPCAFFVLLFLLSLLVHARSRMRMAVIGGTFVLISGLAYFVFMAAWLNVFELTGELRAITTIAGLVAMALAVFNIKDYFFSGGPTLSIPEGVKPGLFKRMRALTAGTAYPALLAGTVTLAVAAHSYQLLCTAWVPVGFTPALTPHELSPAGRLGYLLPFHPGSNIPPL